MTRSPSFTLPIVLLACAATLTGCQTFSPDGGMSLPAEIAGNHLNKEVTAIRTEDDAYAARAKVDAAAQAAVDRRSGRADRPAQQSRPASGL